MKTVFSNTMCAHVWAQQTQPFGQSGSMRFDGAAIYSYQTPIAAFCPTVKGEKGRHALVTSESYSITTSGKHMPAVNRALRYESFTVPDIGYGAGRARTARTGPASDPEAWRPVHAVNLAYLRAQYDAQIATETRRRYDGDPREALRQKASALEHYARAFDLDAVTPEWERDADAVIAVRAARAEKSNTPAAIAARARAAAQRLARQETALANAFQAWRTWSPMTAIQSKAFRDYTNRRGPALLRLTPAGDDIQTSQGATCPVDHARRAFPAIARCRATGSGWHRNGHSIPLGHFQIDEIRPDGSIRAGCHTIAWEEIETFARARGWLTSEVQS